LFQGVLPGVAFFTKKLYISSICLVLQFGVGDLME
jgi:hypothetical protein